VPFPPFAETGNACCRRHFRVKLGWSKSFDNQGAHHTVSEIPERVNAMHTHFVIVISQLVSLLG
jgi:hypothetical protein